MADEGVKVYLELPLQIFLGGDLGQGHIVECIDLVSLFAVPATYYA